MRFTLEIGSCFAIFIIFDKVKHFWTFKLSIENGFVDEIQTLSYLSDQYLWSRCEFIETCISPELRVVIKGRKGK